MVKWLNNSLESRQVFSCNTTTSSTYSLFIGSKVTTQSLNLILWTTILNLKYFPYDRILTKSMSKKNAPERYRMQPKYTRFKINSQLFKLFVYSTLHACDLNLNLECKPGIESQKAATFHAGYRKYLIPVYNA